MIAAMFVFMFVFVWWQTLITAQILFLYLHMVFISFIVLLNLSNSPSFSMAVCITSNHIISADGICAWIMKTLLKTWDSQVTRTLLQAWPSVRMAINFSQTGKKRKHIWFDILSNLPCLRPAKYGEKVLLYIRKNVTSIVTLFIRWIFPVTIWYHALLSFWLISLLINAVSITSSANFYYLLSSPLFSSLLFSSLSYLIFPSYLFSSPLFSSYLK